VTIAAHELAHQWFGNAVTPAWWDELWLSEAFATWLGEKVAGSLGKLRIPVMAHSGRLRALDADERIDATPLIRPIAASSEIEPAFDATAYDKGAAVLAMFERFVGPAAFQAAVRGYLAAHAGRSVTSQAFLDALSAATSPAIGSALASNLRYAGMPVVELALRCDAAPAVIASVRGGVTVPVCVRFPSPSPSTGAAPRCVLAGPRTEQPLPGPAGCPAWLVGNDGGLGYYRTVLRGARPPAPPNLSPDEMLARADDIAIAVRHGELAAPEALAEIAGFAATRDAYGTLAALEIAAAIDRLVADPVRPAWTAWLAGQLADRMTRAALLAPRSVAELIARREIVHLVRGEIDPELVAVARARVDRLGNPGSEPGQLEIAAVRDAGALFDRLVRIAAAARSKEARAEGLEALGEFPAPFAPRIVELLLDARFSAREGWPALATMLARGDTRSAAWRAIHGRFARLFAALTPAGARDAIAALDVLCDAGARAELAAAASPQISAISDGRHVLDRTLQAIDRCIVRRAALGDLAAALAALRPGL
jgi:hypothetical protein